MTRGDLRRRLLALRGELDALLREIDAPAPTGGSSNEDRPAKRDNREGERGSSTEDRRPDDPRLVAGGEEFVGAPIVAKYAGRCGVCGGSYAAGESVVYRSDQKPSTAHVGCGIPDTSRRRRS